MSWESPPQQNHPYKARPSSFQVHDVRGGLVSDDSLAGTPAYDMDDGYANDRHFQPGYSQPAYGNPNGGQPYEQKANAPWWNAKYWGKRTWAILVVVIVVALVAIIVGAVLGSQANSYPTYSALTYELSEEYSGTTFFDNFNYFEGYDPAQGFVHYVPKETADFYNLTYATETSALLKVDTSVGPSSTPDASTGRFSVRLESKKQYSDGLFIFDIKHTPTGCGSWPALWLADPYNWPFNGEIDIMEATNQADDGNQMTLHTSKGCSVGGVKRKMSGEATQGSCWNETNGNAGCGVMGPTASFGEVYNQNQGGIMAVEWRDAGIRMWQFDRSSIPTDITSKSPDPSAWGQAASDFPNTDCNIGNHFKNNSLILNIDLCGQYTEAVWDQSGCASSCTDWVANNPDAFTDAYWEVGAFEIYQTSG